MNKDYNTNSKIAVKVAGGIQIINVINILYIERVGKKSIIRCTGKEEYNCSIPLKKFEQILNEHGFFRSHKSYLIPVNKIKAIYPDSYMSSYTISIAGQSKNLSLSRNRYNELKGLIREKGITIC